MNTLLILLLIIPIYFLVGVTFWLGWLITQKPWTRTYENATWQQASYSMLCAFCRYWVYLVRNPRYDRN